MSISSPRDEEFIKTILGDTPDQQFWIGGKRLCNVSYTFRNNFPMIVCDDFTWSDGTPWKFNRLLPDLAPVTVPSPGTLPSISSAPAIDLRRTGGFGRRSAQVGAPPAARTPVSQRYQECVVWAELGWELANCEEEEKNFICKYW